MNTKRHFIMTLLLGVFLLAAGTWNNPPLVAHANPVCGTREECDRLIQEQNSAVQELRNQEAAIQAELDEVGARIEVLLGLLEETARSIADVQARILVVQGHILENQGRIDVLEAEIQANLEELARINGEIYELEDLIALRMRVTQQMMRSNPILAMVAEANSLVDLVRQMRTMTLFAEDDASLMELLQELVDAQQAILQTLQEQMEELEYEKAELARQEALLEEEEAQYASQQAIYQAQQAELVANQTRLASERSARESERFSAQEIADLAQAQNDILAQALIPPAVSGGGNNGGGNSGGGGSSGPANITSGGGHFIIPLERGRVICEFGPACYAGHTGIDMGNNGDFSTRVLAAASGTVVHSRWSDSFGWWVAIAHNINGSTYTTVYGHMSSRPLVNAGDSVSQGQHIGFMGNTGRVFGRGHLHFEIQHGNWRSGGGINPRNYIHFPSSW